MFLGKGIEEASLDEWHRLCAVNLTGVFLDTKLAVPSLRERAKASPHGSAIVNLASVAGLVGSQLDPLYSMTKGGVTLFTKSAALEFARNDLGREENASGLCDRRSRLSWLRTGWRMPP
jgi:NAD(P)-dependent dehydrogenase (short-subunit alcohol dehydrogenase family)